MATPENLLDQIPELKQLNYTYGVTIHKGSHYLHWTNLNENTIDTENHICRPHEFKFIKTTINDIKSFNYLSKSKPLKSIHQIKNEFINYLGFENTVLLDGRSTLSLQKQCQLIEDSLLKDSKKIDAIDLEISNIFKVYCCEINTEYIGKMREYGMKRSPLTMISTTLFYKIIDDLKTLFFEYIRKGITKTQFQSDLVSKYLPLNDYSSKFLNDCTIFGITSLLGKKEQILLSNSELIEKLKIADDILFKSINGRGIFDTYINKNYVENISNEIIHKIAIECTSEFIVPELVYIFSVRSKYPTSSYRSLQRKIEADEAWPIEYHDKQGSNKFYKRILRATTFYDSTIDNMRNEKK